jgi:hypothetical protein
VDNCNLAWNGVMQLSTRTGKFVYQMTIDKQLAPSANFNWFLSLCEYGR